MARVVVLGRAGTGKSYFSGWLLEQAVPKFDIAVHFDIEDEEIGLSDRQNDPLYKTLRVDRATAEKLNWMKVLYRHRKLRVVPESMVKEEMRALYAEICRVTMRLCKDKKPNLTAFLSCDEAHNILKQSNFPEQVERMITGGRKHGVEALHISQRPQLLHTTLISQADKRVYFGTSDDNDISKINKSSNFPATRLKSLESRRCIVENKDTGEWTEVDTDGVGRERPHFSGDDGIVDGALPV
jgi:DNA helicase HerA-like ATPase